MANIFKKKVWNKNDWDIFLNNLNTLKNKYNFKKKSDFSKKIGVHNIFRRDINRPGEYTVIKLCKLFNVTEEWLSEYQTELPPQAYKQEPEHMRGPKKKADDSDRGSLGIPDIDNFNVTQLFVLVEKDLLKNIVSAINDLSKTIDAFKNKWEHVEKRFERVEKRLSESPGPDPQDGDHPVNVSGNVDIIADDASILNTKGK